MLEAPCCHETVLRVSRTPRNQSRGSLRHSVIVGHLNIRMRRFDAFETSLSPIPSSQVVGADQETDRVRADSMACCCVIALPSAHAAAKALSPSAVRVDSTRSS